MTTSATASIARFVPPDLGVFGLGGLGTDLSLSLRSLQFQEMWTGLWMLAIAMVVLDRLLRQLRAWSRMLILPVALISPMVTLFWGTHLDLQLSWPVAEWSTLVGNVMGGPQGFSASLEISWPGVIGATVGSPSSQGASPPPYHRCCSWPGPIGPASACRHWFGGHCG